MNREQRRRLGRGKRKAAGLAGVSLAAASGLFGAYLGNGRTPRAYAAVTCGTTATYTVSSETGLTTAISYINANPTVDCFTLNIANSFTISSDLIGTSPINLSGQPAAKKITIEGNEHTVSRDPAANDASFLNVKLRGGEIHVSDLTITDMHGSNPFRPVIGQFMGLLSSPIQVYMDNVHMADNEGGSTVGLTYIGYGDVHISDSTFSGNVNDQTGNRAVGGVINVYNKYHVDASTITGSTFYENEVSAVGNFALGGAVSIFAYYAASGSQLTITDSTFQDNYAGVDNSGGPLRAAYGGAVFSSVPVVVERSIFEDNKAEGAGTVSGPVSGGAIHAGAVPGVAALGNAGGLTISDSYFSENTAFQGATSGLSSKGGAVGVNAAAGEGGVSIHRTTFEANTAESPFGAAVGGAIAISADPGEPLSLVNSTLVSNGAIYSSASLGGGVYVTGGELSIDFSTVTSNEADSGGGVFSDDSVTLSNSLVNNNDGQSAASDVTSTEGVTSDHSMFTDPQAVAGMTFTHGVDTLFSNVDQVNYLTDNGGTLIGAAATQAIGTMKPYPGALILNAGTATPTSGVVPTTDQRGTGFPRVMAGSTTMGAVQVGLASAPLSVNATPANGAASISFAPPSSDGGSPVTNYEYQLDGGAWVALSPASTSSPFTITGLVNDQTYALALRAVTAMGAGVASAPVNVTPSAAPPPPTPVFPPSAPRDVTAVGEDRSALVSWREPVAAGSFPVTNYRATASPGGQSCLVVAPALTCAVTGLANGTPYTFTVEALNGAGWSPAGGPSNAVTPTAQVTQSLTLAQGKRTAAGAKDRITTGGSSVGVPEGAKLTPYIRFGNSGPFSEGAAKITVGADGRFTWSRLIQPGKKLTAYVAYEDVESNTVVWKRIG